MFDKAYERDGLLFGDAVSKELNDYLEANRVTGVALDLGCGDGRDTVSLLKLGFAVTAIDSSAAAIRKLCGRKELTADMRHALNEVVGDIRTWHYPVEQFDVIVAATVLDHIAVGELTSVVKSMINAVKPGGVIFVQVHTVDDPGITGQGPISEFASEIRHYFEWNELLDVFKPYLRILKYEERSEWDYDHGPRHRHGMAVMLGTTLVRRNQCES
jgi:SAM-dependent methyltransferase